MTRPRPRPGFVIVNTLLIWVTTAIAATVLWPIYQHASFLVLVVTAVLLGSLVAILGAVFRWPIYVVALVTFGVFLGSGVPLAVPGQAIGGVLPSAEGVRQLLTAVALGWKQLLTITLPVGDYQTLLVPALVLVLATTVTGLSISVRARWGELGVIAPIGLFLVAIALGPDRASWPIPLALAMLAAVLLGLIWRRWRRRREAIRLLARQTPDAQGRPLETAGDAVLGLRTVVAGGVILAVAAAASVGATTLLPPTGARDVVRTAIAQPFDPRDYASPLAGFRRYLKIDQASRAMFTVSGLPSGQRIRIATLDSYDGVVYAVGSSAVDSSSGTFVRIPSAVDQSATPGRQLVLTVTVGAYSGVWVPTVGDFEKIDFTAGATGSLGDGFYYNGTTGTAADLVGLGAGDGYRLTTLLPDQPAESALATATPGSATVPRIGVLPADLALHLDGYVKDVQSPGARLLAALDGLRREGYISHGLSATEPPSRSGHAADRISQLFTDPRMIGDAEQYSVAAALMARQLGFPARVVFGFAPTGSGGTVTVTGADVTAWIEVDTAEYGWVALDPVPAVRPIPQEVPQQQNQVSRPQSIVPPPPDRTETNQNQSTPDSTQNTPDSTDPVLAAVLAVLRGVGIGALVLLVLVAPFLVIIVAKLRRRRLRRTAATPIQRISGGWDEFTDAVVDHGFSPPGAATRSEVAGVVGTLPSRVLAAVADRAVFAPGEPDPADADRVWDAVAELRDSLDTGLTRRQRLRALISVRSLGGYSVRNLLKGGVRR